ncbi:MAG: M20/M25/M40 family metallo-hydrolase [Oscillospiraceae bacterium]
MFDFLNECQAMSKQIAEDRNYLHMHPELSGKEVETLHWIKERLDLMGIEYEQIEGGGIAALIKGRTSGKRLLLRADIDALPVLENEQNLCDFKGAVSKTAGISHACGHDAHTAMLLAALKVLFQNRQEWSGEIVAVFEQGEESACGVVAVL